MTRRPAAELVRLLDSQLVDRHRLVTRGDEAITASVRDQTYSFVHALFRDEVYRRLSSFERTHLHLATAAAMERRWGEGPHDACARIARQYQLAGDSVQAGMWMMRWGDYWLERHFLEPAKEAYTAVQALELEEHAPHLHAQSLVGLGNCARGEGHADQAREFLVRAQEIAEREHLQEVLAAALMSEAMLDFDTGRMQRGTDLLVQAIELLDATADRAESARAMTLLSHTLHGMGRLEDAAVRAQNALDVAHELGHDFLATGALIALGNCWLDTGLHDDALVVYQRCVEICQRQKIVHRAAICWLNIALCAIEAERWDQGREALSHVFANADKLSLRIVGAAHFNLALIAELTGGLDDAADHFATSLKMRENADQLALQVDSRAGLVRIALARNDLVTVEHHLALIDDYVTNSGVDGIEHTGWLFVTLHDAYKTLGHSTQQQLMLAKGLELLDLRASNLQDPDHRRAFLTRVTSHRALRDRARA